MNFQKALQLEQEYLKLNGKEADDFDFRGKLEKLGYTFDTFQKEKEEYLFREAHLEVRETTPDTIQAETMEVVKGGKQVAFIISQDKNWAFYGIDDANKKYVEDNKIAFLDLKYAGGTIISTPKDLEMVIIIKQHGLTAYIRDNIGRLLGEMGIEHTSTGNDLLIHSDLLIDDFKISGFAEKNLGNEYSIYYVQVSFEVNTELISNICITESKKIPKGINDFYPEVNRNQLVTLIKQWLL